MKVFVRIDNCAGRLRVSFSPPHNLIRIGSFRAGIFNSLLIGERKRRRKQIKISSHPSKLPERTEHDTAVNDLLESPVFVWWKSV